MKAEASPNGGYFTLTDSAGKSRVVSRVSMGELLSQIVEEWNRTIVFPDVPIQLSAKMGGER